MEPLKQLQDSGHLLFVEPNKIFSNYLDELCNVSYKMFRYLRSDKKKPTLLMIAKNKFMHYKQQCCIYMCFLTLVIHHL